MTDKEQQALFNIREIIEGLCRTLEDDARSEAEKDEAERKLDFYMDAERNVMIGA